jgi:hypothetical protein
MPIKATVVKKAKELNLMDSPAQEIKLIVRLKNDNLLTNKHAS